MKKAMAFLAILTLALTGFGATKTFTIGSVTPNCGASTSPTLTVDDSSALTDVSFTLAYDTAMLTHTGCTILPAGWSVGSCSAAGGVVTVAISGPALAAGVPGLVSVDFNVLGTVCDGDSTALNLEAVLYNSTNSGTAVDGLCTIACPANVPPGTASTPSPADTATCQAVGAVFNLSWAAATGATSYNVYYGTSSPPPFLANTAALTYNVGPNTAGTTYYWSIEAVNVCGTTMGPIWSYQTSPVPPGAFTNTAPLDLATGVALTNVVIDWADSSGATSYDLYFGTTDPPPSYQTGLAASTYTVLGPLTASTVYYWYVVAHDACSTTTGAQWSFTTTGGAPCVHQAFAFDLDTSNMVRFNLATPGTQTVVGSIGTDAPFGGDFIGGDYTKLYAILYTANQLVYYDTTTAAKTVVGASTPIAGHSWTGMAAAPSGTVYVSSTNCSTASNLYTINTATGAVTSVGAVTNSTCLINLAASSTGQLYGLDIVSNNLLAINSTTGAGTIVGAVGFDANYAQGMEYDADTCTMYMAAYNNTTGQGELRTVNLTTGATTLVGAFPAGDELDAPAIVSCTGPSAPGAFNLLTPADAAIDQAVNGLVLDWADAPGAMAYDLYFGTTNPPTVLVAPNLTASTYTISGLATNTVYYWFVRAKNNCGTTDSATWSFTTVLVANPALSYLSSTTTDNCPTGGVGDGDGVIDPGEDITLTVTAQNTGTGNASAITATLSSTSAGVTITTATAAYPNILAGGTGVSATPYAFHVDFATACGTTLNFTLDFVSAEGTWSSAFQLNVGAATTSYPSTDTPLAITDLATINSVIAAAAAGNVLDVNVTVNITHTWDSDIDMSLIAPDGTIIDLSSDNGSSGDNYTNTVFDDSAATAITAGTAPFTGTYRPEQPLAGLNGQVAAGNWTLRIYDDASGDTGTLNSWTLTLVTDSGALTCNACTPGTPVLAYLGNSFTDICNSGGAGSGDGSADPGEYLSVTVQLTNTGTAMATGVSAILSTATAGVTVTTPNAAYPDIMAGGSQASLTPYVVYIADTVPCATLINFTLAITSVEGTWAGAFTIPVGSSAGVVLLSENFDAMVPPNFTGWTVTDTSGTAGNWLTNAGTHHPAAVAAHSAPNIAYFNSWHSSSGSSTRLHYATPLNLTGYTGTQVSFWMYHDTGYTTLNDRIQVQASTDGTTWANVGAAVSRYNGTVQWTQHTFSLSAYDGMATVYIGFQGISAYGNDCHIDDVVVSTLAPPVCTICACPLPAAFNLLTPPNGATGLPTTGVILDWEDSVGATSYDVSFGTANPPPPIANVAVSTYTVPGTLADNTTYYWSVTARNACGVLASAVWSFTTGSSVPPCVPPESVILLSPIDGATNVPVPVTLSWLADPNATSYEVGLGLTPTNLAQVAITTDTTYTLTGLAEGTTYYWRVGASNECGYAVSPVWSFTTAGEPGPTGGTTFIPAVASATGDRSSQWKTDVRLMNTGDDTAAFSVTFIPADTDGTLSTHIVTGTLAAGAMKIYDNIVQDAFGLTETSGGLRVVADQPFIAVTRTYNDTGDGTYGQLVKGYGQDAVLGLPELRGALRQGEVGHLIHLISGMAFRSNIGFMEITGKAATVTVSLFTDLNEPLGSKAYDLLPMGFHQVSNIFQDMGIAGNHPAARAEVTVSGEGAVLAYASIIDNTTNDAVFTVAQKLLGVSSEAAQTLPAAASTRGAKDTLWRSDVRVLNPTTDPLDITYTYRPVGGSPMTKTLPVPSMNILYAGNAISQFFNISDDTHGSMEISAGAPLVVSSRIYTGVEGTYGQFIPNHRSDQGIVAEAEGTILGLRTDEGYRTNLGLTEIAGGGLILLVRLYDTTGAFLVESTVELAPYQHLQWNDVFTHYGLYGVFEAYAVIQGVAGSGRTAAYASVVDNRTGDAIYVPAQ